MLSPLLECAQWVWMSALRVHEEPDVRTVEADIASQGRWCIGRWSSTEQGRFFGVGASENSYCYQVSFTWYIQPGMRFPVKKGEKFQ